MIGHDNSHRKTDTAETLAHRNRFDSHCRSSPKSSRSSRSHPTHTPSGGTPEKVCMRVTINMASGSEVHWPQNSREEIAIAGDVRDLGVNRVVYPEAENIAEHGRTSSLDSLEHCYKDGCITVATTVKEQVSDILERGSWSPSRYRSSLLATRSSEDVTSQNRRADQMEEYRKGKCKPHFSYVPKAMSQPSFVHSEVPPSAWKEKGERFPISPANDSSVSDELQEVIFAACEEGICFTCCRLVQCAVSTHTACWKTHSRTAVI